MNNENKNKGKHEARSKDRTNSNDKKDESSDGRMKAQSWIQTVMEVGVLVMVCLSPWAIGSVKPEFEFYLHALLGLLLLLWGARMVVAGKFSWKKCPVALCLAAVFIIGIWQLTPMPKGMLAQLSPATARMYDRLLPDQAEVLPLGEQRISVNPPPGSTISLYPSATRHELIRLLAIFLLFAVVRNNIASAASLRRLCLAVLINGALLALLGLIQFFTTAEGGLVFWSLPSAGQVFGPFVNRNHFAFYVNICFGLGLGYLISKTLGSEKTRPDSATETTWLRRPLEWLNEPRFLWMAAALALMLCSVPFCLSRGGTLALLGAAAACAVIVSIHFPRLFRGGVITLSVAGALALLTWLGWDPIEARLATIMEGEAAVPRLEIWSRSWPLIKSFPLWGTGYGTFQYVESLYLHTPELVGMAYVHAHNEYLQAMVEGGLVCLTLYLVAVGFVVWFGYCAFRRCAGTPTGGLVLGALFAFVTILIHSIGEFGLHIPAITVLVTVLCAQMCGLRDLQPETTGEADKKSDKKRARHKEGDAGQYVLRLFGAAPLAGMVVLAGLAWLLFTHSRQAADAGNLRDTVLELAETLESSSVAERLSVVGAAAEAAPDDAKLQFGVAYGYFSLLAQDANVPEKSESVETQRLKQKLLLIALRHCLLARDLCPLLPAPHVRIAANVGKLETADPPNAYLQRARFLAPADPRLWYLCGVEELEDGQPDQAWKSWRRTLELSGDYLTLVLNQSSAYLDPRQMMELVVPDEPSVLLAAANHLYPEPDAGAARRPFLEKGLRILADRSGPLSAEDLHVQGQIYRRLGQAAQAEAVYEAALVQQPGNLECRYDLAEVLHLQGRLRETRRELQFILGQQPGHAKANRLSKQLSRETAKGAADDRQQ